jgi:hypothetical protein
MLDQMCVTAGTIYIQNVNKVCLEFLRSNCHFSSGKIDWRERASAPDRQSSHERNVIGPKKFHKHTVFHWNVNNPVGKSHLVVHMCFFARPNI